jgi:hypothetical protein
LGLDRHGNAAVTGMFLTDLFETSGNIWMTTIASP